MANLTDSKEEIGHDIITILPFKQLFHGSQCGWYNNSFEIQKSSHTFFYHFFLCFSFWKTDSTTGKNIQYGAYDYGILNIPCGPSKTYLVILFGKKHKTKVIFPDDPFLRGEYSILRFWYFWKVHSILPNLIEILNSTER